MARFPALLAYIPSFSFLSFPLYKWLGSITYTFISFLISWYLGSNVVIRLRETCHKTDNVWRVASLCYVVPCSVYIFLNFIVYCGFIDKFSADAVSIGIMLGIVSKLMQKPSCTHTLRILVRSNKWDIAPRILWLPSPETTAQDAIKVIGNAIHIVPHSRISIETGKGSFITDVDKPLLRQIANGAHPGQTNLARRHTGKDFFGFTTGVCNIVIRDEEVLDEAGSDDEVESPVVGQRPTNLTTLIAARGSVRWKDNLLLKANISAGGQNDDFSVACVNHYAAAAPPPQGFLQKEKKEAIRFVPFVDPYHDDNASDTRSEISATATVKSHGSSWSLFSKNKPTNSHLVPSNAPVRDGDTIVIASEDGKFMSIRQGWWISWTENDPRRSGAFKIEIIERAPQIFTDLARSIGSKVPLKTRLSAAALQESESKETGVGGPDTELRTGDFFRLRSVKFPEYELGITSKHIEGDHCYLGLHKAQPFGVEEDENVWCHSTRFTARFRDTIVF